MVPVPVPAGPKALSLLLVSFLVASAFPLPAAAFHTSSEGANGGPGEDGHEYLDGFPIWETLVKEDGDGDGDGGGSSSRYLAATGEHCYVYVDGGNPSQEQIDDLVDEFDNVIWPADTSVFGTVSRERIDIHVDIIDGPYGIGGYYIPGTWSIYIDVSDLNIWGYEIAAHEFQHLIHDKHDQNEDLWLNEAMSELAVHVIYGPSAMSVSGHLNAFENNPDTDLTVFENEMYDYGSSYAFALYLWEHFGGNDTIRAVVDETDNGLVGVTKVLRSVDPAWDFNNIEMFSMWSVANIVDDTEAYGGLYGYKDVDLDMRIEASFDNYASTCQGTVISWGNDYFFFENGADKDLVIDASRIEGSFNFSLAGIGPDGVLVRSSIIDMNNDNAEIYIPRFGSSYTIAFLAVSGWEGERYKFVADFRDSVPPVTTIVVSPTTPNGDNNYYTTRPNVGFVTSEPADTYFRWDGDDEELYCPSCPVPVVPVPPEGEHTLYYYSVDADDNREEDLERAFLVDTIVPRTNVTVYPEVPDGESGWFISNVTVTLTTDEEEASTYYRWDSGFYHEYEGPIYAPEGSHSLHYYSKDFAGNEEDLGFKDLKVDTRDPKLAAVVYPAMPDGEGGWYLTRPTIAFSVDEPTASIYYTLDGGTILPYEASLKIEDGTHTIEYWARDQAGNRCPPASLTFSVDTEVPETDIDITPSAPDGENGWYVTEPDIELSTQKDATVYYRWDGDPERKFTGTVPVSEGVHKLQYWSKDKAGNVEPARTLEVKLDTVTPSTDMTITGTESYGWYLDEPTIEFETDDDAITYYRWDEGGVETRFSIPIRGREGIHTLFYRSVDEAGNSEDWSQWDLQIDPVDPEAFFTTTPSYAYVGEEIAIDVSGAFDNIGIASMELDFGDGDTEKIKEGEGTFHSYASPAVYTITLTVVDLAGRESRYDRQISIEKKPSDGDDDGGVPISTDLLGIGALALLAIIVIGVAVVRYRRRKALERYVQLYEAEMRRRRRIKARRKNKKGWGGGGTGPRKGKAVKKVKARKGRAS